MKITINNICSLVPYNTIVFNENYECDYVGVKYSKLNGVYPLYNNGEMLWQYTTNTNSTGSCIANCKPILRNIKDIQTIPYKLVKSILESYDINYTEYEIAHLIDILNALHVKDLGMSHIDILRKLNFDVDNLIENDLAIDVESLKNDTNFIDIYNKEFSPIDNIEKS